MLVAILDEAISKQSQIVAQAVEFDCRANELCRLQDQVFDVLEGDILGQVPDPDLLGQSGDVDDARRFERPLD
ncbi:hypothetical protein [Mesorhizobium sp. Mes31]|uniref:hypothetical protein n=1 Tax=Mesorhizobium sp. Mes31 TaxID=2926017 RepID=UPI0021184C0E|nr:hypothetical protein [Mesorhizobium sp. Mes31]